MATIKHPFGVVGFMPASSSGAQYVCTDGSNFPVESWAFDAATQETLYIFFKARDYGSGNVTLNLMWYAATATSGDVVWGAAIAAITPDTDSQDVETKAFTTASTVTDSHLGTTGKRVHQCSITLSSLDSLAANDLVCVKLYRDAASGSDTMAGDARLLWTELTYSDT